MPVTKCYYCNGTGKEGNAEDCLFCKGRGFEVTSDKDEPLICPHCSADNYIPSKFELPQLEGMYDDNITCKTCGKKFSASVDIKIEFLFKTHKIDNEE